ncbi:hypothetical protein [Ekhidna sp.]|uniref:hypothetical protein n=1 Tax=Ekhidna sp. TaxID=2608089 RepID=UPI003BA8A737
MSQKFERNITKVFHGALLTSFLTIAIPLVVALATGSKCPTYIVWLIFYANFFVLWPLIILSLVGLVIFNFKNSDLVRGIEKSSVRILTMILTVISAVLVVYLGTKELKFRNNKLSVTFKNNSSEIVSYLVEAL